MVKKLESMTATFEVDKKVQFEALDAQAKQTNDFDNKLILQSEKMTRKIE